MFKKKCSILDTPSLENTLDIFIGKIDKFIQSFWEKRDRKLLKPDQAESFSGVLKRIGAKTPYSAAPAAEKLAR
jgi:hypothetical protein